MPDLEAMQRLVNSCRFGDEQALLDVKKLAGELIKIIETLTLIELAEAA